MKNAKIRIAISLLLLANGVFSYANPFSTFFKKLREPILSVEFSYPLNLEHFDAEKKFLTIKFDGQKTKDGVDAITSASKAHSTFRLKSIFRDENKKAQLPESFVNLLLFPVTASEFAKNDSLVATQTSTGAIEISFFHRENAYKIVTENDGSLFLTFVEKKSDNSENNLNLNEIEGNLNVSEEESAEKQEIPPESSQGDSLKNTGFYIAKNAFVQDTNGLFSPNAEENAQIAYENDTADSEASHIFCGKIQFSIKDEILFINARLSKKEVAIYRSK